MAEVVEIKRIVLIHDTCILLFETGKSKNYTPGTHPSGDMRLHLSPLIISTPYGSDKSHPSGVRFETGKCKSGGADFVKETNIAFGLFGFTDIPSMLNKKIS